MIAESMPFREPKPKPKPKRIDRQSIEVRGIPHRIKELRRLADLGQVELDKLAGVGQGTLSKFESGQKSLDTETLFRYSRALGANVHYLVTGEGPKYAEYAPPLRVASKK